MIIRGASQSILVVGPLPPPVGGVTVFLSRWIGKLRNEGRQVTHVDPTQILNPRYEALRVFAGRYDEILINSLNPLAIVAAKIIHPLTPIVAVDHNASRTFARQSAVRRLMQTVGLSFLSRIVVVSPHLRSNYRSFGQKIEEANPFVAPDLLTRASIESGYTSKTKYFLESDVTPLLVVAAWRPVEEDGRDLYGLTDSLRLLERINCEWPKARLVVFVGDVVVNRVWTTFCSELKSSKLSDRVSLELGQKEMWPILAKADVMLRLTPTDGNSVSVHEALWAGCAVVASDAVTRPIGVTTYEYGDIDDLVDKVNSVLEMRVKTRSH